MSLTQDEILDYLAHKPSAESLNGKTIPELKQLCECLGVKVLSTCRKPQIIEALVTKMSQVEESDEAVTHVSPQIINDEDDDEVLIPQLAHRGEVQSQVNLAGSVVHRASQLSEMQLKVELARYEAIKAQAETAKTEIEF